jgi:hypothetical protein
MPWSHWITCVDACCAVTHPVAVGFPGSQLALMSGPSYRYVSDAGVPPAETSATLPAIAATYLP